MARIKIPNPEPEVKHGEVIQLSPAQVQALNNNPTAPVPAVVAAMDKAPDDPEAAVDETLSSMAKFAHSSWQQLRHKPQQGQFSLQFKTLVEIVCKLKTALRNTKDKNETEQEIDWAKQR